MGRFKFYALKLSGFIIIVFLFQLFIPVFTEMFLLNDESLSQFWRFLTAIFLHGDLAHLFYNLLALALFGSMLEFLIGGRKFLVVFFVSGILANIIAVNFYPSSLGASGAIFGIIGALIVIKPWQVVWAFGLPMPIIIAGVLWAAGDVLGIFFPSNVGNIAHLSGMFFGLVLGTLVRRRTRGVRREKVKVDEKIVRDWEKNYLGR